MSIEAQIGSFQNTAPTHPLNALRRVGTVQDLSSLPATLGVLLDGDTDPADTVYLPYMDSYHDPQVGDVVVILSVPPDNIVLGGIAGLNSPAGRTYYEERWVTPVSIQPSTTVQLANFQQQVVSPGWVSQFDSSGVWRCPFNGVWTVTLSVGFSSWAGAETGLVIYVARGTDVTDATARIAVNQGKPGGSVATMTVTATKYIPNGGHLCFAVAQSDSVARTTANDQRSYVSIDGRAVDNSRVVGL